MTVHRQLLLILLILLPGNVAVMSIVAHNWPLVTGNRGNVDLAVRRFGGARAPKDIGPCIGRMMQEAQDIMVVQRSPGQLAPVAPTTQPMRKGDLLLAELTHGRAGRASLRKRGKHRPNRRLDLPMRIEDNALVVRVTEANG